MKINGNNKKKLLREAYLFDSVNEVGCTRKVDYKIHHSLFFFSKCRHHNAKTKNSICSTWEQAAAAPYAADARRAAIFIITQGVNCNQRPTEL